MKELNGVARAEGSDYQYHADGRVKFASDVYGRSFGSVSFHDKSYQYDHAGRLQQAFTAVMANDFLNGTATQFASTGPYLQNTSYDAWDNLLGRDGLYWNEDNTTGEQIYDAHNRNFSWSYDADGRIISMNEPPPDELTFVPAQHTYDAAGRHVKNTQTTSRVSPLPGNPVQTRITTIDAVYDGDGQQVKRIETTQINSQQPTSGPGYFLRSSVLGGRVVTEYNSQGTHQKSYVYGAGELIASSSSGGLAWRYNNPLTGDGRETNAQGGLVAATYLDPGGIDAGATDPANAPSESGPEPIPMLGAIGAFFPGSLGGSGSCIVDGMELGCGFANSLMEMGAADQCPDNDCGPRTIYDPGSGRNVGVLPLSRNPNTGGFMVTGTVDQYGSFGGRVTDPDDGTVIYSRDGELVKIGSVEVAFFLNPQQPGAGSFWDCFSKSGLGKTHAKGQYADGKLFNSAAADLLLDIHQAEGTSLSLLAVTLMNENTTFNLQLNPNTNSSSDTEWWDVGPFQINQHYTNKAIEKGEVKNEGGTKSFLAYWDMYGPVVKEGQPFSGSPLANGRMAARRLNSSGSTDRQKAINYAQREGRGKSYDSFAPLFESFFNCYQRN